MIPAPRWSTIANLFKKVGDEFDRQAREWIEFFEKLRRMANLHEDLEQLIAADAFRLKQEDLEKRIGELENQIQLTEKPINYDDRLSELENLLMASDKKDSNFGERIAILEQIRDEY